MFDHVSYAPSTRILIFLNPKLLFSGFKNFSVNTQQNYPNQMQNSQDSCGWKRIQKYSDTWGRGLIVSELGKFRLSSWKNIWFWTVKFCSKYYKIGYDNFFKEQGKGDYYLSQIFWGVGWGLDSKETSRGRELFFFLFLNQPENSKIKTTSCLI